MADLSIGADTPPATQAFATSGLVAELVARDNLGSGADWVEDDLTPDSQEKARSEGLFGFIEKPVKIDTLLSTLASSLRGAAP